MNINLKSFANVSTVLVPRMGPWKEPEERVQNLQAYLRDAAGGASSEVHADKELELVKMEIQLMRKTIEFKVKLNIVDQLLDGEKNKNNI